MRKNIIFLISLFTIIFASCGRHDAKSPTAKVMNSTSASASNNDPYAPEFEVQFKGSGGNDAWMLNWYNWYTGGKANIPVCGPHKVSEDCLNPNAEAIDFCTQESNRIKNANFQLGYYLQKVDHYPFCKKKCTPTHPTCDGISCIPNVLSYAGKKILEYTQACQAACQDAISVGMEFPYECKNLNDNYNRKELIYEIEAERQKLLADPTKAAQVAQLAAIKAKREEIENQIEKMKKAEEQLPGWLTTVYDPRVKALTEEMKIADDKILILYTRAEKDIEPVQKVTIEINKQFTVGIPSLTQLEKNQKDLEAVRPKACLAYDFNTAVSDAKTVQNKLKALTDELLVKLTEVGSKPLYDEGKAGIDNLLTKVSPTPVAENILNGSFFRDVCNNYRKMIMVNSLLISKSKVGDLQNGIDGLIKNLNLLISGIDTFNNSQTFKESIRSQALKLNASLTQARVRSQWNIGNRLAFDSMKALHLVMIPAIELNNSLSADEKVKFISEIRNTVEVPISEWNHKANDLGLQRMIESRKHKITGLITIATSKIGQHQNTPEQRILESEFQKFLKRASLQVNFNTSTIQELPKSDSELIAFDDQLSELENIVREFIKTKFGSLQ